MRPLYVLALAGIFAFFLSSCTSPAAGLPKPSGPTVAPTPAATSTPAPAATEPVGGPTPVPRPTPPAGIPVATPTPVPMPNGPISPQLVRSCALLGGQVEPLNGAYGCEITKVTDQAMYDRSDGVWGVASGWAALNPQGAWVPSIADANEVTCERANQDAQYSDGSYDTSDGLPPDVYDSKSGACLS